MIRTFFRLVGKAIRFSISRPLQRFNIESRAKKYLGEEAKYFKPAPRAIGAVSLVGPSQYPHLVGPPGFKSVKQRRLDAIAKRNQRLLGQTSDHDRDSPTGTTRSSTSKSFSEVKQDDDLIIENSSKLPLIKTVTVVNSLRLRHRPQPLDSGITPGDENHTKITNTSHRPLPKSTNLQLDDPTVIWQVDNVPPGRLNLHKLQELLINKLADDIYWTPKQISETYNIKEKYAENIITYLKQIRIILSPGVAKQLDYVAHSDPTYQATKHIIYVVDYSLRSENDKKYDETFLPTDELDPEVRATLSGGKLQRLGQKPDTKLTSLFNRPQPLRISPINKAVDKDDADGREIGRSKTSKDKLKPRLPHQ